MASLENSPLQVHSDLFMGSIRTELKATHRESSLTGKLARVGVPAVKRSFDTQTREETD